LTELSSHLGAGHIIDYRYQYCRGHEFVSCSGLNF